MFGQKCEISSKVPATILAGAASLEGSLASQVLCCGGKKFLCWWMEMKVVERCRGRNVPGRKNVCCGSWSMGWSQVYSRCMSLSSTSRASQRSSRGSSVCVSAAEEDGEHEEVVLSDVEVHEDVVAAGWSPELDDAELHYMRKAMLKLCFLVKCSPWRPPGQAFDDHRLVSRVGPGTV
eukprot:5163419-Amphidinium_carterae.1